jgi:hypothetical protein
MSAIRYSFGGDEHVFAEIGEEMSLEAFFKGMAICTELEKRRIAGVSEICPSNASYLVRFDPDVVHPDKMLSTLKEIEAEIGDAELELPTRIVEIPVLYNDPWTRETLMRFRERHQDPNSTDIEYGARINGYRSVDDRYAEADRRPRRLLHRHLLGARRRRLSAVRHHPGADLRPGAGAAVSQGLHGVLPPRRHRQVEADHARGI